MKQKKCLLYFLWLTVAVIVISAPANADLLVGQWLFDETSGTDAADSSGYGNDGTLVNGLTFPGSEAGCLTFDGVDDRVNIPNGDWNGKYWCTDADTQFTVTWELDIRTTDAGSAASNGDSIMQFSDTSTAGHVRGNKNLVFTANGTLTIAAFGVTGVSGETTTVVNDGGWHHVKVVWEMDTTEGANDTVTIYVGSETLAFTGLDWTAPDTDPTRTDNIPYWTAPGMIIGYNEHTDPTKPTKWDPFPGDIKNVEIYKDLSVNLESPANEATKISQETALNWKALEGMDGIEYAVYFGADPNTHVATVSTNSYAPAELLNPNTVYQWKIVALQDSVEIARSDVWTFTTGGVADAVYPLDEQPSVSTQPLLTWAGDSTGSYIEEYDVYFGDTTPPPFVGTTTETSWQINEELTEYTTTYYWKVVPKHGGSAIIPGFQPVWSFTVGGLLGHWPMDIDPNDVAYGIDSQMFYAADGKDPNYYPGVVDNAAYFDGTSAAMPLITDMNDLNTTNTGLTVACWVKMDNGDDAHNWNSGIVSKNGGRNGSRNWALYAYDRNENNHTPPPSLALRTGDNLINSIWLSDNEWHFVVATSSPLERKVWVDGVLEAESAGVTFEMNDNPLALGGRLSGTISEPVLDSDTNPYRGYLDDVWLYDRPLTEAEMIALYTNSPMAKLPLPEHEEKDVPFDTDLSWTPGSSASMTKQVLYYGLKSDWSDATSVELAADANSYDIPVNLELGTTYYWRVDSVGAGDTLIWEGTTWHFRTMILDGDIAVNKAVELPDVQAMASAWLDDDREEPNSINSYLFPWTEPYKVGEDPDIQLHFDDWHAYDSAYGMTYAEINDAPVADPNYYDVPSGDPNYFAPSVSQTIRWHVKPNEGEGAIGNQVGGDFIFANDQTIDLSQYSKVQLWVKPHNIRANEYYLGTGTSYLFIWQYDLDGDTSVVSGQSSKLPDGTKVTWTDASAYNNGEGRWVRFQWTPSSKMDNFYGIGLWLRWAGDDLTAQQGTSIEDAWFELGDIYLYPKNGDEPVCLKMTDFNAADLNHDCLVNLSDFAMLAEEWLLDARNL